MKLPRIAFIGNESLTASHGTGMMFARHFSKYPRSRLMDIHFRSAGGVSLFRNELVKWHHLDAISWNHPSLKKMNLNIAGRGNKSFRSFVYRDWVFDPVSIDWDKYGGPPDLVYSTCYTAPSFSFLHHFHRSLPKKVPIVQHFLDFDLTDSADMIAYYRELVPYIVSVWSLTTPILKMVSKFSVLKPEIVQALHQPVSNVYKQKHREFSPDFRSLLIGNVWSGSAYLSLREIWSRCQKRLGGLDPVSWVGHLRRFDVLRGKNLRHDSADPAIQDFGLVSVDKLGKMLNQADIALVPFTGKKDDDINYSSFSLPSRMGDYCASGLPIVVLSRKGTAPARFVQENRLGIVIDPANEKKAAEKLEKFILDRALRAECGKNCRQFMERDLNLHSYQKTLYPRLVGMSSIRVPSQC